MKKQQPKSEETKNSPLVEGCDFSRGVLKTSSSQDNSIKNLNGIFKKYKNIPYNPELKERAGELRKAGNLSEVLFWNQIKRKQFLSLDFHRQKIIGNYIVDFYCPKLNLVVEIDGDSHNDKIEYDNERDNYLIDLGLKVLHFDDIDVKRNLNSVMEYLREYCEKDLNTPSLRDTPLEEGKANTPSLRDTPLKEGKANTPSLRDTPLEEGNKRRGK